MKKKVIFLGVIMSFILAGCSFSGDKNQEETVSDNATYSFDITGEQFTGIKVSQDKKFLKENMEDNSYYVEHDGYYYPLAVYKNLMSDHYDRYDEHVHKTDIFMFSSENEKEIPTLFEGDRLIYYSTSSLLDYTLFYRMMDNGYTIGLANLQSDIGGNVYIDISSNADTDITIMPDTEMYELYNQSAANQILIDKISGQKITKQMITNGTLRGLKKDAIYDLDLYLGTYYSHCSTPASFHVFTGYEKFASTEYIPLQEYIYEVPIPDYFVTGYYAVRGEKMFRLVRGKSYNTDTFFNEQLLFLPDEDEGGNPIKEEDKFYETYSENRKLCRFWTTIEGKLGYKTKEEYYTQEEEDTTETPVQVDIDSTIMKQFDIWLPEGECEITVTSPTDERTGNIVISFSDGTQKSAEYSYIDKTYSLIVNGRNEKALLSINGFVKNYNVQLTGCEQYKDQDVQLQKQQEQEQQQKSDNIFNKAKEWLSDVLYLDGQKD